MEFEWSPGLSVSAKRRCIERLHGAARRTLGVQRPLEISSYSNEQLGRKLSSLNLPLSAPDGTPSTVEAVFQACKVFAGGSSFPELARKSGREARRDPRLVDAAGERRKPVAFRYGDDEWPADGSTAFYDWLYIRALLQNPELARELENYDAFTDIAFNPERSLNCQARAAAIYCALLRRLGDTRDEALAKLKEITKDFRTFEPHHAEVTRGASCASMQPDADGPAAAIAQTGERRSVAEDRSPLPLRSHEAVEEAHPTAAPAETARGVERAARTRAKRKKSKQEPGQEQLALPLDLHPRAGSTDDTASKSRRSKRRSTRARARAPAG